MRRAFILLAATWLMGCATLAKLNDRVDFVTFGSDFNDLCIAGKVKSASANWLKSNQETWAMHGDYTEH